MRTFVRRNIDCVQCKRCGEVHRYITRDCAMVTFQMDPLSDSDVEPLYLPSGKVGATGPAAAPFRQPRTGRPLDDRPPKLGALESDQS